MGITIVYADQIPGPLGPQGPPGPPDKLEFNTAPETLVGDLVKLTATNFVTAIGSNSVSEIPQGIFGYVVAKPSTGVAEVAFNGLVTGLSGLTPGGLLRVQPNGKLGQSLVLSGVSQNLGTAISTNSFYLKIGQPFRRN